MDEKTLNLNNYLAKPDKTIEEHIADLLNALEILKNIGYIKKERIYKLSKKACELHDLGKVNDMFHNKNIDEIVTIILYNVRESQVFIKEE
jgi:CRISPR-associated endonuclease/helicase Cas3